MNNQRMKPKKAMVERIATIIPIATRNNPFTISEMMPKRMPNIPKAVRTIKPHTASPMYCATCLKFAVVVISTLFLIFFVFNADSRAEGVEFQSIISASRLSDIFFNASFCRIGRFRFGCSKR